MKRCLTRLARVVLLAALAVSASALTASEIKILERQTLDTVRPRDHGGRPDTPGHQFKLTLVYFSGGKWARDAMLKAVWEAAEILGQCGVRLAQAELMLVDAPQRYQYFQMPVSRELARTLQPGKPTVYFVADTRQQPAFDAEAVGRRNSRTRPELADSIWLTRAARDPGIALAHELVHVLSDSGEHVGEAGNLMREDTAPGNTRLTAMQCARLRDVGAANGLLRAVAE